MSVDMTSLDEETPGRACEECSADLSDLPDEARFCLFCGAELEVVDGEGEDSDIEESDDSE